MPGIERRTMNDRQRGILRLTNAHGHFAVTSAVFAAIDQSLGGHTVAGLRRVLADRTGIAVTRYTDVTTVAELLIMLADANGDGLT
jgi:hypothetical protein